jgi:diaminopimelate decarboxylase
MKLVQNRYQADGIDLVDLVEKYGSPVYVYQTSKMKLQYEKMLHAFKDIPQTCSSGNPPPVHK